MCELCQSALVKRVQRSIVVGPAFAAEMRVGIGDEIDVVVMVFKIHHRNVVQAGDLSQTRVVLRPGGRRDADPVVILARNRLAQQHWLGAKLPETPQQNAQISEFGRMLQVVDEPRIIELTSSLANKPSV